jgi:hypothetical protein
MVVRLSALRTRRTLLPRNIQYTICIIRKTPLMFQSYVRFEVLIAVVTNVAIYRHVVRMWTDVLEESITSTSRVENQPSRKPACSKWLELISKTDGVEAPVGFRFPIWERIFSSSRNPDRILGPPSLLTNRYRGGCLPGSKATGEGIWSSHLQLVPRSRKSIHPLSHTSSRSSAYLVKRKDIFQ